MNICCTCLQNPKTCKSRAGDHVCICTERQISCEKIHPPIDPRDYTLVQNLCNYGLYPTNYCKLLYNYCKSVDYHFCICRTNLKECKSGHHVCTCLESSSCKKYCDHL